jgi:hypothetical protein
MTLTYSQISGITRDRFVKKLYDNIFNANPLLMRMKEKGNYRKIPGGLSILVPLEYAQITAAGWYQGADTLSTTDNETMTAAQYAWKQFYANITISRRDELMNKGDDQIIDLVKSKVKTAEKTVADNLSTGLYNAGSVANQIVGLRAIVGTSNTIGGISQSSNSWWQGQVDSTTTTLTVPVLQTLYNNCAVNNEAPTLAATTKALYNSYYGQLQPQQRFTDSKLGDGGFQNLLFNGVPVVADTHCPSSHWFFVNENNLFFQVHEDEDMRFDDFIKTGTQNVKTGKIYWMGALCSSNNRLHGKFSALTA